MPFWFTLVGLLFVGMALARTRLAHLPITTAQLYLGVGIALGAAGLVTGTATGAAHVLEIGTEIAVIVSLFTAGLKLRLPLSEGRWILPVRLATLSMLVTVGAITLIGVWLLDFPPGVAVLLGAILAPTDPVLASDVQVRHPDDRDRLRFSLTGEAGLNDGTAFPFVMLGLGLLGWHDLGPHGLRWLAVDVAWAVPAGLGVGWGLGLAVGHVVIYLRRHHRETVGVDDFLTLGLIALSYGAALLLHAYGFLAVFAAGLALRHIERRANSEKPLEEVERAAHRARLDEAERGADAASDGTDEPEETRRQATFMAEAVLGFNEQLERIGELAVVLITGSLLVHTPLPPALWWFVPLVLLVVRPLGVWIGLWGAPIKRVQRRLVAWFGIRGIGSLYYLAYALTHGLDRMAEAETTAALVLGTVAASIVVHGLTLDPLMRRYRRQQPALP